MSHSPSRAVLALAAAVCLAIAVPAVPRPLVQTMGALVQHQQAAQPQGQQQNQAGVVNPQPAVLRSTMQTPQVVPLDGMGAIAVSTAIPLTVPRTATYDAIFLECAIAGTPATKAQLAAQVALVQVILDGEQIWELTGTELLALGQYELGTFQDNTGILVLPFARRDMRLPATEDLVSLGTEGVDTFQVLVTLSSTATIDGILPSAQTRPQTPLGRYITYRRSSKTVTVTGEISFPDIAQGFGWNAGALHFIGAADASLTVTALRLYAFGGNFLKMSKILNDERLRRYGKYPQSGWVHMDLNARGRGNDPFPLQVNDFIPYLTFGSAPGTVQIILERWEQRKVAAAA